MGLEVLYGHSDSLSNSATTTNLYGIKILPYHDNVGGDVSTSYGIYIDGSGVGSGRGPNSGWGIYQTNSNPFPNRLSGKLFLGGEVRLEALSGSGERHLCIDSAEDVKVCSSSLRHKENIRDYKHGLDILSSLRPVVYNRKGDKQHLDEVGLIAEEVNKVAPVFAFSNGHGDVEGVHYESMIPLLVNAINEQQKQIDKLESLVQHSVQSTGH